MSEEACRLAWHAPTAGRHSGSRMLWCMPCGVCFECCTAAEPRMRGCMWCGCCAAITQSAWLCSLQHPRGHGSLCVACTQRSPPRLPLATHPAKAEPAPYATLLHGTLSGHGLLAGRQAVSIAAAAAGRMGATNGAAGQRTQWPDGHILCSTAGSALCWHWLCCISASHHAATPLLCAALGSCAARRAPKIV